MSMPLRRTRTQLPKDYTITSSVNQKNFSTGEVSKISGSIFRDDPDTPLTEYSVTDLGAGRWSFKMESGYQARRGEPPKSPPRAPISVEVANLEEVWRLFQENLPSFALFPETSKPTSEEERKDLERKSRERQLERIEGSYATATRDAYNILTNSADMEYYGRYDMSAPMLLQHDSEIVGFEISYKIHGATSRITKTWKRETLPDNRYVWVLQEKDATAKETEHTSQSMFDRMNRASEECIAEIRPTTVDVAKKSGVEDGYPMDETQNLLRWIIDELELNMPHEDWDYLATLDLKLPFETDANVNREFRNILNITLGSAEYDCDKSFGFEERRPSPKTEGAKLGEMLLEPFTLGRKQFFQSIPEEQRKKQAQACKLASRSFLTSYQLCMKSKIPELH